LEIWNPCNYFEFQSAFMDTQNQHLDALQDIKKMMERSSRFISLSGLSGIAAGICALIGAAYAKNVISTGGYTSTALEADYAELRQLKDLGIIHPKVTYSYLQGKLIMAAAITFAAAFILAFLFTYIRSKKQGIAIWGNASQRLMLNVCIPMLVGGVMVVKLLQVGMIGLVAPCCLMFYGLALVHGSKYTLGEVRYLGYMQIVLGILSLWYIGYGLYFWAAGFGVMHILYGAVMWWKYERNLKEG
jgi:hypothetical protein